MGNAIASRLKLTYMNSIKLLNLLTNKKYVTKGGLPIAKKMWRDGYNKAIDDIVNLVISEMENEDRKKWKQITKNWKTG